ncbi:hypothetical protein DFH07DRAFT_513442 [Mycena maculata]|uniref:Uncharacterized protein n=1 Tax=Mycena maculata TaxID=230809 RepID=A0AAD7IYR1_9AGAR|nr:hypothetical protein DFH07DRAFT_513442 [Mycena maculata]
MSLNWDGIQSIYENDIITNKGDKLESDIMIFATGFVAVCLLLSFIYYTLRRLTKDRFSVSIRGRSGKTVQEHESQSCPKAYIGTTVSGFPNLFMVSGPNTIYPWRSCSSSSPF